MNYMRRSELSRKVCGWLVYISPEAVDRAAKRLPCGIRDCCSVVFVHGARPNGSPRPHGSS